MLLLDLLLAFATPCVITCWFFWSWLHCSLPVFSGFYFSSLSVLFFHIHLILSICLFVSYAVIYIYIYILYITYSPISGTWLITPGKWGLKWSVEYSWWPISHGLRVSSSLGLVESCMVSGGSWCSSELETKCCWGICLFPMRVVLFVCLFVYELDSHTQIL